MVQEHLQDSSGFAIGILEGSRLSLRVQVSNNWVLGAWATVIVVQVLGRYIDIRYLDP